MPATTTTRRGSSLKLLTLNVNGLRDAAKQATLLQFLMEGPWNVVCLQDTHFLGEEEGEAWLRHGLGAHTPGGWPGTGYFTATTSPHVGGVAILLKPSFPGCVTHDLDMRNTPAQDPLGRCLRLPFTYEGEKYCVFSVYAPVDSGEQRDFFTLVLLPLVEEAHGAGASLILGGDWNNCASPSDFQAGGNRHMRGYQHLRVVEEAAGLMDAWRSLHGPNARLDQGATFVSRASGSVARLDRWLVSTASCNPHWLHKCHTVVAPRADHLGVSLVLQAPHSIPRGNGVWSLPLHVLDDPVWRLMIKDGWHAHRAGPLDPTSSCRQRWDDFKIWVKHVTIVYCQQTAKEQREEERALEQEVRDALSELAQHPNDVAPAALLERYTQAFARLDAHHRFRAEKASVHAGVVWQDFGEKPTLFFHKLARARAADSCIPAIQPQDPTLPPISLSETADSRWQAMDVATAYFSGDCPHGLYRRRDVSLPDQDALLQCTEDRVGDNGHKACLGPHPSGRLTLEECSAALDALARGKRPGMDGLPTEFYRVFWEEVGNALVEVFNEAFDDPSEEPTLSPSQREGCTILLYKGEGLRTHVSSYRPITLLNADYKLLAKLLATRVGPALQEVIHPTQTAFVPGRWIGENILAHMDECDLLQQVPVPAAIVFTDFSKAYDTLDRGWLRRCLVHMGFPAPFLRWVDLLLASNTNRLLVNGWLSSSFPLHGGVRQGCPASPPLYIVATQPLAAVLRHLERQHVARPIALPGISVEVSWQHADDLTLHLEPSTVQPVLELGLQPFCRASGQELNVRKCKLLVFHVEAAVLEPLGMPVVPHGEVIRHLGIPLGVGVNTAAFCAAVVDGLARRAAMWSSVQLSLLGRIYVAKQELLSKMVHILSFLPLPRPVLSQASSILNHFVAKGRVRRQGEGGRAVRPSLRVLGLDWKFGGCRAAHLQSVSDSLRAKVVVYLLEPTRSPWKPLMRQWWERNPGWYATLGGEPRSVDAWRFGECLPFSTFSTPDLQRMGVPARVTSYIDAFRKLQAHRPPAPITEAKVWVSRELLFYNPLVVDADGAALTPRHRQWGFLAALGVRRVGDLQALVQLGPAAHTDPNAWEAARALWDLAVPTYFKDAASAPLDPLPASCWVGTAQGPFYCLEGEASRDELVMAVPHRVMPSGMLRMSGLPVAVDAFALPLLAVETFNASRPWARDHTSPVGEAPGEQPYLLGPMTDQPGSRRGWYFGGCPLLEFTTRFATHRLVMLAHYEERQGTGQPVHFPMCPAIWGQGLQDINDRHNAAARQRALGHEEEREDWVVFQGYAWERTAPPRPAPAERVRAVTHAPRDWTVDPMAGLVQEPFPEWGSCWQALRDTSLPRTHRSTVYLLLHGALTVNGEAFYRHMRETPWCPHSCCGGPDPSTRPVETLTHAFLECPVAQAVMMWLSRVMEYMDGTTPPATVDVLLLGRVTAWRPETAALKWVWLHLRVACLHHLFHHRDMVSARGHPSSPFAVVGSVVSDLALAFHADLRRVSDTPLRLPGVCADWLRGRRRLPIDKFDARWLHRGLASRDGPEPPRFRLSVHFPVPLATCIPLGFAF